MKKEIFTLASWWALRLPLPMIHTCYGSVTNKTSVSITVVCNHGPRCVFRIVALVTAVF